VVAAIVPCTFGLRTRGGAEGIAASTTAAVVWSRKRAAIARALAIDPELILYDEPTADLDPVLTEQIGAPIARIRTTRGSTQLIVTHDLGLARAFADRIAVLDGGRIVECTLPAELAASSHPLTREFLRAAGLGG
jgi:phospholipid/cholesterol/gamma-HCH transport system ATP-binding protein